MSKVPEHWKEIRTEAQLKERKEYFHSINGNVSCRCDFCDCASECHLAYDLYNTDGDCLLEK